MLPLSKTATHVGPAAAVPVSCGVGAAASSNPFPWGIAHTPSVFGVPTPTPILIVAGGPALVRWIVMVPVCVTVKLCERTDCADGDGEIVPVNTTVVVGDCGGCTTSEGELEEPPQPATSAEDVSTNRANLFILTARPSAVRPGPRGTSPQSDPVPPCNPPDPRRDSVHPLPASGTCPPCCTSPDVSRAARRTAAIG